MAAINPVFHRDSVWELDTALNDAMKQIEGGTYPDCDPSLKISFGIMVQIHPYILKQDSHSIYVCNLKDLGGALVEIKTSIEGRILKIAKATAQYFSYSKVFQCEGVDFHLSREMQNNLLGLRGGNHFIQMPVLQKCLKKKIGQIKDFKENKEEIRLSLYFYSVKKKTAYNLILLKDVHKNLPLCILTGYYLQNHVLQQRFTSIQIAHMERNLAKIDQEIDTI